MVGTETAATEPFELGQLAGQSVELAAWPDDRDHGSEGAASLSDSLFVRTAALCHGESGATTASANY